MLRNWWPILVGVGMLWGPMTVASEPEADLRGLVEADWQRQEERLSRTTSDTEAIRDALTHVERLVAALTAGPNALELRAERARLAELRNRVAEVAQQEPAARTALYREIRWLGREVAWQNPLLANHAVLFLKQRRFKCQMLHEHLGYYYDFGGVSGGGVCVLEEPGRSLRVRELTSGRLPRGAFTTLALSYDARTAYFAFSEVRERPGEQKPLTTGRGFPDARQVPEEYSYFGPQRHSFHVFSLRLADSELRQLTEGREDDFDPCPMPDGRLLFISTRRGGFGRCHQKWEPLPTYTLHRMEASGEKIETISWHETNEWQPSVLHDGRVIYSRWDYVDRSASHFHGLWLSNPDGTNPAILFGNYTEQINACYQPRAIPNSPKIVFIAGAHHAAVGGALVVLDPGRVKLDAVSGEDRLEAVECVTPEVVFPEAPEWPDCYYHSPWPLSEDVFLVAYSDGPLPGMGPGYRDDKPMGLYYLDRFGNRELLYRDEDISSAYPIPLTARPVPPVLAPATDPGLAEAGEGEFVLANVQWGLHPLPAERPIRELRVYQLFPKTTTHMGDQPKIGYAFGETARGLLGTVPVEADGSAYFRAPARKPLYFQAVDAEGRAVHGMRSLTYLQPGERRGCVGCHEPRNSGPPPHNLLAVQRPPSKIQPGPDGSAPLSYPRLVQPVWDHYCVACHDGTDGPGKHAPELTGVDEGTFSRSYVQLQPFVRWYEWGKQTIAPIAGRPGQMGADVSPLSAVLEDDTHRKAIRWSDADRRRIHLWLDSNAPFYGTYEAEARAAQRKGMAVALPAVQ